MAFGYHLQCYHARTSLPMSHGSLTRVVVAYSGNASDNPKFMSLLDTTIADMHMDIIDWEECYDAIDNGCLCAGAKAECTSEGEIDEEEGEEGQPTDAPVAKKRNPSNTAPRSNKKAPTKQLQATHRLLCHGSFGEQGQAGQACSQEGKEMSSL